MNNAMGRPMTDGCIKYIKHTENGVCVFCAPEHFDYRIRMNTALRIVRNRRAGQDPELLRLELAKALFPEAMRQPV